MVRRVLPGCKIGSRLLVERLRDTILYDAASTSGCEFGYRFLVEGFCDIIVYQEASNGAASTSGL